MPRSPATLRLALSLAALSFACGGGDLTLPSQGEPALLEYVSGDDQGGTVGEPLAEMLVVRVEDRFGDPVPNVPVRWTAAGGGSVDPAESTTDARGHAATRRILGSEPTTYTTTASVEGIEQAVQFTSTALSARLVITSQIQAIAVSGVPLDPQPTLQLQDADGTPIAREGVNVSVGIIAGVGQLSGATATSNAAGEVAFTDLAIEGSPGTVQLIFAAEEFAPATSGPIALGAGAPASIELVAGDDQSAPVGEAVPTAPSVRVLDEEGTPLPGIPVTFTVTAGGGTVVGPTPVTDANGIAAVEQWRLGPTAGANQLSAEVTGEELSGSPVVFSATATAGGVSASESQVEASPTTITASSGASAATITVRVRDQFGNPVAGVPVALAVNGTGNTLTQPSAPTDANGIATGRLSSSATGTRTVSATAGGVALDQVATVTVQPGTPSAATSTATVPNGRAGERTTIEIQLRDALGNPAPGRASAIAVTIAGANNVGGVGASDEGGGRYTASYTPQVAGADQVTVEVSGAAVAGSPFTSVVQPGPGVAAQSSADVPPSVSLFTSFTITVTIRDQFGNVVGHGGDPVALEIDGAPQTLTDNGDGTYSLAIPAFTLTVTTHQVVVTLGGANVTGSPYSMTVTFP